MSGNKFRSRKLLLILAFLLIDTSSIFNLLLPYKPIQAIDLTEAGYGSTSSNSSGSRTVWLTDESAERCFGIDGFSECSELNLWRLIRKRENFYQLEAAHLNLDQKEAKRLCLGRKKSILSDSVETKLLVCDRPDMLFSALWYYNPLSGMFATHNPSSHFPAPKCFNKEGQFSLCRDGQHSLLHQIPFASITNDKNEEDMTSVNRRHKYAMIASEYMEEYDLMASPKQPETVVAIEAKGDIVGTTTGVTAESVENIPTSTTIDTFTASNINDIGEVKHPGTELVFQRNLDDMLDAITTASRQVLMGTGIYTRAMFGMTFNIYAIGWYVEAQALQAHPAVDTFRGQSLQELQASSTFNELMSMPLPFDRSIVVKLAMSLKKDVMIEGLVAELNMKPSNSKILHERSSAYNADICPEGLEIAFTYRHATELFEIRIDRDTLIVIDEPGIAQDFFSQFFSADPVTEDGKRTFLEQFPILLQIGAVYTPRSGVVGENSGGGGSVDSASWYWIKSFRRMVDATGVMLKYVSNLATSSSSSKLSSTGSGSGDDTIAYELHEPLTAYYSYTLQQPRNSRSNTSHNNDQQPRRQSYNWKIHFNNLIVSRPKSFSRYEERIAAISILLYCILLIVLSLPPALLQKGVRVVAVVKQRSVNSLKRTISKTLSRTRSLVTMTRPASTDLNVYFK